MGFPRFLHGGNERIGVGRRQYDARDMPVHCILDHVDFIGDGGFGCGTLEGHRVALRIGHRGGRAFLHVLPVVGVRRLHDYCNFAARRLRIRAEHCTHCCGRSQHGYLFHVSLLDCGLDFVF
jgi:hypothetical protein